MTDDAAVKKAIARELKPFLSQGQVWLTVLLLCLSAAGFMAVWFGVAEDRPMAGPGAVLLILISMGILGWHGQSLVFQNLDERIKSLEAAIEELRGQTEPTS